MPYQPTDQPPAHLCHARNCTVPVPPRMLMCLPHWRKVPILIQRKVWKHYRPGQEVDKRPSREYLEVMKEAVEAVWEREQYGKDLR